MSSLYKYLVMGYNKHLMSLQDALSVFLIIGLVIFIICISTITFFLVKAFKAVTNLAEDIKGKTQLKALASIPGIFLSLVSATVSKLIKKRR